LLTREDGDQVAVAIQESLYLNDDTDEDLNLDDDDEEEEQGGKASAQVSQDMAPLPTMRRMNFILTL